MTDRRSEPGEAFLHRAAADVAGADGENVLRHRRRPAVLGLRPEQGAVVHASQPRPHAGHGPDEQVHRRNVSTLGGFAPPFNRQMARFACLLAPDASISKAYWTTG